MGGLITPHSIGDLAISLSTGKNKPQVISAKHSQIKKRAFFKNKGWFSAIRSQFEQLLFSTCQVGFAFSGPYSEKRKNKSTSGNCNTIGQLVADCQTVDSKEWSCVKVWLKQLFYFEEITSQESFSFILSNHVTHGIIWEVSDFL